LSEFILQRLRVKRRIECRARWFGLDPVRVFVQQTKQQFGSIFFVSIGNAIQTAGIIGSGPSGVTPASLLVMEVAAGDRQMPE